MYKHVLKSFEAVCPDDMFAFVNAVKVCQVLSGARKMTMVELNKKLRLSDDFSMIHVQTKRLRFTTVSSMSGTEHRLLIRDYIASKLHHPIGGIEERMGIALGYIHPGGHHDKRSKKTGGVVFQFSAGMRHCIDPFQQTVSLKDPKLVDNMIRMKRKYQKRLEAMIPDIRVELALVV